MKCSEVQNKLAENLSSRYEAEIGEHLENCPECREFCNSIGELDALSRALRAQHRAPDDFHTRLFEDYKEISSRGWFTPRSFLASFCLVVFLAGLLAAWDQLENDGEITASLLDSGVEAESIPITTAVPEVPDENSFVEVVIDSGDEQALILRLPPVIEIHSTEIPDEETHYHTVSY